MENNILIAKFMGYIDNGCIEEGFLINPITNYDEEISELKYHSDWNWLMEVVGKIEGLKPISFLSGRNWTGFEVKIYKTLNTGVNYCTIKYMKDSGDYTISTGFSKISKIDSVYNSCVEFIKWYNERQSKNII